MLSQNALQIMDTLNRAGYEAFAVGGCVRDALRGISPEDIDITTNALPEQVITVFADRKTVPTGLQHGTVTVLADGKPYEITTYRTDGNYSDARHPDQVSFTASLQEDLKRRDFTVNAMAYHPAVGIVDPFEGQKDLKNRVLRCVGDPATRFTEDALRIARLVRFMSVLDFEADPATADAAELLAERLDAVAAERKRVELTKMLMGDGFLKAAMQFPAVLCRLVPALSPLIGFDQKNPHHSFDIYEHTVRAVASAPHDLIVRLAVLLHDIGKPQTFFTDENGIGHFYGHPAVSAELAKTTLQDLRFDNATIQKVLPLVEHHDLPILAQRRQTKRCLSRFGEDTFRRLLDVKRADACGCHADSTPPDFSKTEQQIEDILSAEDCLTLHSLAVSGKDLLAMGIPAGPRIGRILQSLLNDVLEEQLENDRNTLLTAVKERYTDV